MKNNEILKIKSLYKKLGYHDIINDLNLSIQKGERIALIGPNGAGKSTLFHLISGKIKPNQGEIIFKGKRIDHLKPFEINRLGLSRSFQMSSLFKNLTVLDHLRCGVLWRLNHGLTFLKRLSHLNDVNQSAIEILEMIQLDNQKNKIASSLNYADQRVLEIGMTLASGAEMILLDEPMAGMNVQETHYFTKLIHQITQHKTLLIIEHDMSVVFDLADKIAVLVYGKIIAFDTPEMIRKNKDVQNAYLGFNNH